MNLDRVSLAARSGATVVAVVAAWIGSAVGIAYAFTLGGVWVGVLVVAMVVFGCGFLVVYLDPR